MAFRDRYNPNNPNTKNVFPNAEFKTYGTALCGIGVSPPIFVGVPSNGAQFPNSLTRIPAGYYPYTSNGNCIQNFNTNYVGTYVDEYAKCQR